MEWLQNLKPGDRVIIDGRFANLTASEVERVTATKIITTGGRFRKLDGFSVGGSTWERSFLREPNQELLGQIELRRLRNRASQMVDAIERNIPKTIEGVQALIAALEPFVKKPEGK